MSKKRKLLKPFKGKIGPAQAAEGIEAAYKNARSLLADAQLLFDNDRWERTVALSILAIEEVGKVPIIRGDLLLSRNNEEQKRGWGDYRSHTKKNVMYLFPALVARGGRRLEDFREIFDESSNHPEMLDALKQIAFYSDCLGNCHWSIPSEVVDKNLAKSFLSIAKLLVSSEPGALCSKDELDIWVKHMGRVWKASMPEMKRALLDCYVEARSKGVLRGKYSESDMMKFLYEDDASSVIQ